MMNQHLGDKAFAAWTLDAADEAALGHLEACGVCRKEAVDFRRMISVFRDALHRAAEAREIPCVQPAENESETDQELPTRSCFVEWRRRLIPLAALLAIALVVAFVTRAPKTAPPRASNDAADNALLIEIQSDLNRQAPEALAPAEALLAQENPAKSSDGKTTTGGTEQ